MPHAAECCRRDLINDTERLQNQHGHNADVGKLLYGGLCGIQPDSLCTEKDQRNTDRRRKDSPPQHAAGENPAAPLPLSGCPVLTGKGGRRLCKGLHHIIREILKVQCRGCSRYGIGAKTVDGRLNKYIGETKNSTLNSGRQSDGKYLSAVFPLE